MGPCKAGTELCSDGGFGSCVGEVLPASETCNGVDDDCDGVVDDGNPGGGAVCGTGQQGVCAVGMTACSNGAPVCNPTVQPSAEICDALDNDCDGTADEGNPGGGQSCNTGQSGACATGASSCVGGTTVCNQTVLPSVELCDGVDNDCNGTIDNGNPGGGQSCNTGQSGVCSAGTTSCAAGSIVCNQNTQPKVETCNGLDDDCDGAVDEGSPGAGQTCTTGQPGVCGPGTTACQSGSVTCIANVQPGTETCNGLDDDCDGTPDDGNPGGGQSCTTGNPGICAPGTSACQNGSLTCVQNTQPATETCNGIDDDCDGTPDDGNPGGNASCNTGSPGACAAGLTSCTGGGIVCNQSASPTPEICDGIDNDCDGQTDEGNPGGGASCTTGAPGICSTGTVTCTGGALSCQQTIFPATDDVCGNGLDDDCDGSIDENPDLDGDGFGICNGDCCDSPGTCGQNPVVVNPGAYEVAGNGVDDDCDGQIDNPLPACDTALPSNSANPLEYARAMDLCQTTTENPPLNQKKWGVISGNFFRANGAGAPNAQSRSIRGGFGSNVPPQLGQNMAVLSTGRAAAQAAPNNTNPNFAPFQGGQDMGTQSGVPGDWLAANGNNFPNAPGCPEPQGGTNANDPIMLKLRIRVPTNAKSFTVKSFFYSSEYPEWVCSAFNDFFLTLLDSSFVPGIGEIANPADKNLAFYDPPPAGGAVYPVGVNLAFGNTGLFRQCLNGQTGCGGGSVLGNTTSCQGITQLLGTGFDIVNAPPQFPSDPSGCGASNRAGGGTSWLTTGGNIMPGETIEMRFVIWDTGDPWYDSVVLLDAWNWGLNATTPGTQG